MSGHNLFSPSRVPKNHCAEVKVYDQELTPEEIYRQFNNSINEVKNYIKSRHQGYLTQKDDISQMMAAYCEDLLNHCRTYRQYLPTPVFLDEFDRKVAQQISRFFDLINFLEENAPNVLRAMPKLSNGKDLNQCYIALYELACEQNKSNHQFILTIREDHSIGYEKAKPVPKSNVVVSQYRP